MEKKKLQFKKNDEIVITIEDLGKDGEGIGHVDGYALFVKGALPGEKVLVHLMKLNKNYGFARLVEILEPSKERMTPSCPSASLCGGCTLQHFSYEGQLAFKEKKVKDCLERLGGVDLSSVTWLPILGMTAKMNPRGITATKRSFRFVKMKMESRRPAFLPDGATA